MSEIILGSLEEPAKWSKRIVLENVRGQWFVRSLEIAEGSLPLLVKDVGMVERTLHLEQRIKQRELNIARRIEERTRSEASKGLEEKVVLNG